MHLLDWSPAAVLLALLTVAATMLALSILPKLLRGGGQRRPGRAGAATRLPAGETYSPFSADVARVYAPFSADPALAGDDTLVVDCTHPSALTFTHHKGGRNPPLSAVPGSDCSTGIVLNALHADPAPIADWMGKEKVSVNHFDADALLSMWSYMQREAALKHEPVLRHAARVGDFREAALGSGPLAAAARGWDGLRSEEEVHAALKLACWINSVEMAKFSAPYEGKDADAKFDYFLQAFQSVLEDPERARPEWEQEYQEVLEGWQLLEDGKAGGAVARHEDVGLAVLRPPRPLHYYCLFSHALGLDVVLCMYPGRRYELECRYTQYVNVYSRPVHARLDLGPLAAYLNEVDSGREAGTSWATPSYVDTGPLLRLDKDGEKLPKRERYGHPRDRPMFASGLEPAAFEALVLSYLRHGLAGRAPQVGGWSWEQLHEVNEGLEWEPWRRAALAGLGA